MSQRIANKLSLMRNALGRKEFPDISPTGGNLETYPVIASEWVSIAGESNGDHVYMVSAGVIYFADDGDNQIDLSTDASLVMTDAPSEDGTDGTGASLVSLYQDEQRRIPRDAGRLSIGRSGRSVAVQAVCRTLSFGAKSVELREVAPVSQ